MIFYLATGKKSDLNEAILLISMFCRSFILSCLIFIGLVSTTFACPTVDGLVDVQCDGQVVVVAFGDSITQGYLDPSRLGYPGRLSKLMPNISVVNLGQHGENTTTGVIRARRELDNFPDADYIILLEGVNDFYDQTPSVVEARENLLGMIAAAKATGAKVLVGNLTATKRGFQRQWILDVNKAYKPLAAIDFYGLGEEIIGFDGIHPTTEGYTAMAKLVRTTLKKLSAKIKPKDSDKDGLYDYEEIRLKTSSRKADSDGDGLTDGKEVWKFKTNPRKTDTDGDAINDRDELYVYKTDPLEVDTDGDGNSDGDEISVYLTDPLSADLPLTSSGLIP